MNLTKEFWEKTYKENAPKMKGVCYRYVHNKVLAEDLMQDAFITAINKSDSYLGKGSFGGWLRKIAVNTTLTYLRNEKSKKINNDLILNEQEFQEMDEPNASNIRGLIEQADFSDKELLEVIGNLPEHHRLVFNLYVIDNYTHVQIGKELNISAGTSKSHLARARKKIQQLLHQKALERTQAQNKKKRASLLFILTYKSNYIDRLFKAKLNFFSLEPFKKSKDFFDSIKWDNATTPKFTSSFFSSTINFWVLGSTAGIMVFIVFFYVSTIVKKPTLHEIDPIIIEKLDTITHPILPVKPASKPEPDSIINISNKELKEEKPVIIKTTIIERKTITIRDTVRIKDSINAE